MHSRLVSILLAMGLIAALNGRARAQAASPRIAAELERTTERIERARGLVVRSGTGAARTELDQAVAAQANARSALASGRPRLALGLTIRARRRADRVIALLSALPDSERVAMQLQRSREWLDRIRHRTRGCDDPEAATLLASASDLQAHAEEAARADHQLAALQLTQEASRRAREASRRCHVTDSGRDAADGALRRTDQVLRRATERLGGRPEPRAARTLAQAATVQEEARQEFQAQHWDASIQRTLAARALALRAQRIAGRES